MKRIIILFVLFVSLKGLSQNSFEAEFDTANANFLISCNLDNELRYDLLSIQFCDSLGQDSIKTFDLALKMPPAGQVGGSTALLYDQIIPFHGTHLNLVLPSNSPLMLEKKYLLRLTLRRITGEIEIFEKLLIK